MLQLLNPPVSQVAPVNPDRHLQRKLSNKLSHVAPLAHGSQKQWSTTKGNKRKQEKGKKIRIPQSLPHLSIAFHHNILVKIRKTGYLKRMH